MKPPPPAQSPAKFPGAGSLIAPHDAVAMLRLQGTLGAMRNDPRAWRQELLMGINRLLSADGMVAYVLKNVRTKTHPTILSHFDAGFQEQPQRQAILHEINVAPLRDPLSQITLRRFASQDLDSLTCLRAELVHDDAWNADPIVAAHRGPAGLGDCIFSLHRGTDRSITYALCAHRHAADPSESANADSDTPADRFGPREQLLLDTLHRGLAWLYAAEESAHRLNRASDLAPRQRQTLEHLLAGDSERQIAAKMTLSIHTVHGYVKSLYTHFGVSSRTELISRWLQAGGQFNPPDKR